MNELVEQAKRELMLRQARAELQRRQGAVSPEMQQLSNMTQNPQVQPREPRQMGLGERILDNVVGLDNGVISGGEKLATALNMGGERFLDNAIGIDNGVMSAGEQVAAAVNKGGESMTLGIVGDEAAGGFDAMIGRGSYENRRDAYRQQDRDLRQANPALALGAEVAPAFIPGVGLAGVAARGTALAGRAATGAALGAAAGGIYGFAEGDEGNRVREAVTGATFGAMFGAAAPRVAETLTKLPNGLKRLFSRAEERPSVEVLRAVKNAAYNAVDNSGEVFAPQEMQGLAQTVRRAFEEGNYVEDVDNASRAVLSVLDKQQGPVTLSQLDRIRQNFWKRYAGAQDQPQILDAIKAVDDLVESHAGSSELMAAARAANSRFAKSQLLEDAFTKATDQTASTGSGGNILNKYRQAVTSIINNPSKARFFTDDEIGLMRDFVRGSTAENVQRLVGKLSPTGNGLMASIHAYGAYASGGATIPLMAVGAGAKALADRSVRQGAETVQNVLSGYRPIPTAPQIGTTGTTAAIGAGLGVNSAQQRLPNNRR